MNIVEKSAEVSCFEGVLDRDMAEKGLSSEEDS
jgi:hypothetical protein